MDEGLARAQALVDEYAQELVSVLPENGEIFDAHVHLGQDIDGFSGTYDDLMAINDRYRISRCFMFCLDEPARHPAFGAANDRTLAYAERSGGRLIPFVRLDLAESPIEEAVRCLDRGARGIKLHPRAQRFLLNDERLAPVFELAAERKVPILIHGGRGLPPIEPTAPKGGETFSQPLTFARIHQYLSMATPLLWTRQPDTIGVLGLALNACYERDGHQEKRDEIRELLSAARELWRTLAEV